MCFSHWICSSRSGMPLGCSTRALLACLVHGPSKLPLPDQSPPMESMGVPSCSCECAEMGWRRHAQGTANISYKHPPKVRNLCLLVQILKGEHLIGHCLANRLVGPRSGGNPPSSHLRLGGQSLGKCHDLLLQQRHWAGYSVITGSYKGWGRPPKHTHAFRKVIMFVFTSEVKICLLTLPPLGQAPPDEAQSTSNGTPFSQPRLHSRALVSPPFQANSAPL